MKFKNLVLFILTFFTLLSSSGGELIAAGALEIRCGEIPFLKDKRPSWSKIPFLKGKFLKAGKVKGPPVSQQTRVKAVYDKENLYFLFFCEEKNMENVVAFHSGPDVWKDDCIEIFIDSNLDETTFFQFVVSVSGEKYAWGINTENIKGWSAEVTRGSNYWKAEIIIPFSLLGIKPYTGNILGISFCRERRAGELELSTWTPPYGFCKPEDFGRLVLGSYYDFLEITSKSIKESLEKILEEVTDENKVISKVQKWEDLLKEAKGYIENHNLDDIKFSSWLREKENLEKTINLEEVKYEIKMEELLNR